MAKCNSKCPQCGYKLKKSPFIPEKIGLAISYCPSCKRGYPSGKKPWKEFSAQEKRRYVVVDVVLRGLFTSLLFSFLVLVPASILLMLLYFFSFQNDSLNWKVFFGFILSSLFIILFATISYFYLKNQIKLMKTP